MNLELDGKVVLVSGGSQGLGFAAALACALEGARIALCSRDPSRVDAAGAEIARQAGGSPLAVVADMTSAEDCRRVAEQVLGAYGRVDALINNVGGPPPGGFTELNDEQWRCAFELTFMSAVRLTREVLPTMRTRRWGRIVNIASYSVRQPIDGLMLSNSLRLAVVGWAKSLANEVAADNVLVNTVCPGWIRTDRMTSVMKKRADDSRTSLDRVERGILEQIPLRRIGTPSEVASLITFLCSGRASYITGTTIPVDGGITRNAL